MDVIGAFAVAKGYHHELLSGPTLVDLLESRAARMSPLGTLSVGRWIIIVDAGHRRLKYSWIRGDEFNPLPAITNATPLPFIADSSWQQTFSQTLLMFRSPGIILCTVANCMLVIFIDTTVFI